MLDSPSELRTGIGRVLRKPRSSAPGWHRFFTEFLRQGGADFLGTGGAHSTPSTMLGAGRSISSVPSVAPGRLFSSAVVTAARRTASSDSFGPRLRDIAASGTLAIQGGHKPSRGFL